MSWLDIVPIGIQAITSIFGAHEQRSARDAQIEAQKESDKFNFLVKLAELKYGQGGKGGGGGGGSMRNRNADLIEVLNAGANRDQDALNSLAKNYIGALKGVSS